MTKLPVRLWRAPLLLLLLLAGCVNFERSYPDKRYFTLEISGDNDPSSQTGSGVLEVVDLGVSRRYEGQSFLYRISETGYESDFYNQFLVAPGPLISEELRKGLTGSGLFEHVINSSSELQPTHRLEGTVNALYGDFRNINAPKAILEIQFFLTKQAPKENQILMDKRYSKSVPLSGRTPEALVQGWDQALDGVLTSLIADLKSAQLKTTLVSPTPLDERGRDTIGGEASR
jgi:cholesterol transport system auxiliary component